MTIGVKPSADGLSGALQLGALDVLTFGAEGLRTGVKQIQGVSASVAGNALTVGLAPTSLDFRDTSATSGAVNTRTAAAALSLVVPSGATLGTVNGQAARLVILAIDSAGTVELAVANLAGGVNLDETTLISTTAISAAASSASTIYSTAARTNVPFRVVGFIDITQATAGTWASAPTLVKGAGGQALAALSSLGYGQTMQTVTGSRSIGTTYYNTTGRPIFVMVRCTAASSYGQFDLKVNGVQADIYANPITSTNVAHVKAIVPPGASYLVSNLSGSNTLTEWNELR